MVKKMGAVLVAGGVHDPNVNAFVDAALARGMEVLPLLIGEDGQPSLTWDLSADELCINGALVDIDSVFIRRDVFHQGGLDADYRALAWFSVLQGWLAASPQVRVLNRPYLQKNTNKLQALRHAEAVGFKIPPTVITNDIGLLQTRGNTEASVAKPVTGGGYCKSLGEALTGLQLRDGISATPAIVQRRLGGPDVRIYSVNNSYVGFQVRADKIDYRESRHRHIELLPYIPEKLTRRLRRLMDIMELDWCAADFKADSEPEDLTFLEINSNPMFSVFDRVAQGAIMKGVLDFLSGVGDCGASKIYE